MHTQGVANITWFVATAGVMLFEGPAARWCTHKVEHTKSGLWPPQESCDLRGHMQGGTQTSGGGLHEIGQGSVRAAIASEGFLLDDEFRLHDIHVHDQFFLTRSDDHVKETSMKQ